MGMGKKAASQLGSLKNRVFPAGIMSVGWSQLIFNSFTI